MNDYIVRNAHVEDVKSIHALLMECALKGLLLPRPLIYLYGHIRNFKVIEYKDGVIVACCALAPVWEDLGEICSLVVRDDLRRLGLGRKLVQACAKDCAQLRIKKLFALTYQEAFFSKLGFSIVDKDILPQKIWADCVHCPKYPNCDETAVMIEINNEE